MRENIVVCGRGHIKHLARTDALTLLPREGAHPVSQLVDLFVQMRLPSVVHANTRHRGARPRRRRGWQRPRCILRGPFLAWNGHGRCLRRFGKSPGPPRYRVGAAVERLGWWCLGLGHGRCPGLGGQRRGSGLRPWPGLLSFGMDMDRIGGVSQGCHDVGGQR